MSDEPTGRPWLPHMLFELYEVFGLGLALRFGAEFGGRRLSIPEAVSEDHPVAQAFGVEVLAWLIKRWGKESPTVPLGPHSSYKRLVAETRRLVQGGEDAATIIRAVGCHERTIYRHRRAIREQQHDDPQGSLDLRQE